MYNVTNFAGSNDSMIMSFAAANYDQSTDQNSMLGTVFAEFDAPAAWTAKKQEFIALSICPKRIYRKKPSTERGVMVV